jgi:hypothetical protein
MKLEVVGSSILMVDTEPVASSKTLVSFYQTSCPKDEILEELRNRVTDVQQHIPFSPPVDECDSVVH